MKKVLILFMVTALATAVQATTLAWESWGQVSGSIGGYAGTDGVTESGLTGTWTWTGNDWTVTRSATAGDWTPRSVDGGVGVDELGGDMHWIEGNSWTVSKGTRSLASSIDLTTDGTYYMSFFSQAGSNDALLEIGLANATSELMWGNAYGNNNPSQGITAYYQALDVSSTTNADGTFMNAGSWATCFWVAEIARLGGNVTVGISQWNIEDNGSDISRAADVSRIVDLGAVSDTFDLLKFKHAGGSGLWPGMDEFRLGDTLESVTVPEPATMAILGLGALLIRRKK